jgi:hypothetical protein
MLSGGIDVPGHPSPANVGRLDLLCMPQISRMQRVGVGVDPRMAARPGHHLRGPQAGDQAADPRYDSARNPRKHGISRG